MGKLKKKEGALKPKAQPTRPLARSRARKSYERRYLSILFLVLIAVIGAIVFLEGQNPTSQTASSPSYNLIIHVYNASYQSRFPNIPPEALVVNVTITVTGPKNFGDTTPTGVLSPSFQIPSGSYTVTATKPGYQTTTVSYNVGDNCQGRDLQGICHAWLPFSTKVS